MTITSQALQEAIRTSLENPEAPRPNRVHRESARQNHLLFLDRAKPLQEQRKIQSPRQQSLVLKSETSKTNGTNTADQTGITAASLTAILTAAGYMSLLHFRKKYED